ncbi:MAG: DUF1700 domain-containing protein [Clostridia bacterium]|nr:DUF1700 domain-containing protein [Lachnospiraceae bacterium]NCB99194.1 DUF1700 domain-containing protein [Clostridia bacterium]NCD02197.1 DUF1700 domain-containing protein [Clostridia bacterium]
MTKQGFLLELQAALAEELSDAQVYEQVNYYSNYIDEQMGLGRSESEVLQELGDARLIARTVIDGIEQDSAGYTIHTGTTYTSEEASMEPDWKVKMKAYGCLGLVLIVIFLVIALVTRLFIWMLPSILVVALLVWIFKQLNGR